MNNDAWVIKNLATKIKQPERKFVEPVIVEFKSTRKHRIALCVLGSWAIDMPPYGLARLTALTRAAGFTTKLYDFNVRSHYDLKQKNPELATAFEIGNYWWWEEPHYWEKIYPTYKSILDKYIQEILDSGCTVVGFSVYYTNILSTQYVITQLKAQRPSLLILLGGPQCNEGWFEKPAEADYYFIGECEQTLLNFLENLEQGIKPQETKIGTLYNKIRVDIDSLPPPDYSDLNLYQYTAQNSICSELSRGCTARCTYCSEVWYWKFRDRNAVRVVDELEFQVKRHNTSFVFFVDSLVNGNLNGLRAFCEELIERGLNINWWGYARIDKRMDLEFYKLLKRSGCLGLNYGVESGSDIVLKAINKNCTVADVNANLKASNEAGVEATVCWIIGAPGEDTQGVAHSLNCLWNNRKYISAISPGTGLGVSIGSAYDDRKRFNINERDRSWLSDWYTLDFKNTKLHRHLRIKLTYIWLDLCNKAGGTLENVHSVGDINDHYAVEFKHSGWRDNIPYEDFDYNLINSGISEFADTSMNEVFSFLRLLWRVRGPYTIHIKFDPERDYRDFPKNLDPEYQDYSADIKFSVTEDFQYHADFKFSFKNHDRRFFDNMDYEYHYKASGEW